MRAIRTTTISILALGLLAGSAVGVAAQEDADPMAPSFFTAMNEGDWDFPAMNVWIVSMDASDPRISGKATLILNEADYRDGATSLAPTGSDGTVATVALRLVNDDGSWEGELSSITIDDDSVAQTAGWLTGAGAYEGLFAYWVRNDAEGGVVGHITPDGPLPALELPAE